MKVPRLMPSMLKKNEENTIWIPRNIHSEQKMINRIVLAGSAINPK